MFNGINSHNKNFEIIKNLLNYCYGKSSKKNNKRKKMNCAGAFQYIVGEKVLKCESPLTWKKVNVRECRGPC